MFKKLIISLVIFLICDLIAIIIILFPVDLFIQDTEINIQANSNSFESEFTYFKFENKVFITPCGECYHNRKACAGKNAISIDIDSVQKRYRPCKKCV